MDERMAARFATERYCIQSNNSNAKSTTSKIVAKIKIKGSPKCFGKKDGPLGVRRTNGVLKEAETIQKCLKNTNTTSTIIKISKKFSREMRRGNVHNAIKLLMDNMKNGILHLTEKTMQQVKQNYPPRCNADLEVLLPDKSEEVHPIKFTRQT